MSHYHHLSMEEREKILIFSREQKSIRRMASFLGRSASTISREIRRNASKKADYSAVLADRKYRRRRKNCKRNRLLDTPQRRNLVRTLFLDQQWSPEEISNRLKFENNALQVSCATIYRGIYSGMFDDGELSHGSRGVIRRLRHHGKPGIRKAVRKHVGKS